MYSYRRKTGLNGSCQAIFCHLFLMLFCYCSGYYCLASTILIPVKQPNPCPESTPRTDCMQRHNEKSVMQEATVQEQVF